MEDAPENPPKNDENPPKNDENPQKNDDLGIPRFWDAKVYSSAVDMRIEQYKETFPLIGG
jgi:hypothetical protein